MLLMRFVLLIQYSVIMFYTGMVLDGNSSDGFLLDSC